MWNIFRKHPKSFLGIDIGTSSIKIVEVSGEKGRKKLENYGEISIPSLYEQPFRTFAKNTFSVSSQDVSKAIRAILKEANIKGRDSIFPIPDFCSFFTDFELPPMTDEEIPQAVQYEARQHIPMPLSEVTLDWSIIKGKSSSKEKSPIQILLVTVPNEVINQYQEIISQSKLKFKALEAEVFGLVRSLIKDKDDKRLVGIIDIGAQSTSISGIDEGVLKLSHSFDISGNEFTQVLSKALNIDYNKAEELKKKKGLKEENFQRILAPLIDLILIEVKKIFSNLYQNNNKKVEKIIIAGGSALLPGLKEYFLENLKFPFLENFTPEIEIADPFSDFYYPPILEETLKQMGPAYAIAAGAALKGLE